MKKVRLSDHFLSIEEVINPPLTYNGCFFQNVLCFMPASKTENKQNLFQEFLEKYYYKKAEECFCKPVVDYLRSLPPFLLFSPLSDSLGGGRCIYFHATFFLYTICQFFGCTEESFLKELCETESVERQVEFVKTKLKSLRKDCREELEKKKENFYLSKEEARIFNTAAVLEHLNKKIQTITNVLVGMRPFIKILTTPLPLDAFAKCFYTDKFYMIYASIMLYFSRVEAKTTGLVHNGFAFCHYLAEHINRIKKEFPTFSYATEVYKEDKLVRFSTEDFLKEYEKVIFAAPNYMYREIEETVLDVEKLQSHAYVDTLAKELLETNLHTDWEILAPGKRLNVERKKKDKTVRIDKNKEEQYQNIRRCKLYLDGSPYLFRVIGKNLFDGYIGYVYANGNILFEKFYRNFKTGTPALGCATYQMRFDNFVSLSKMKCLQALLVAKNTEEITKISHDHKTQLKKWFLQVEKLTLGNEKKEEVESYMRRLLKEKKITQ